MSKYKLPFRQIHLDYHTSQHIPEIAGKFNPDTFADTLENASVNSVTCFARGHHGWLYYDSKKFPERIHPHLKNRNFLKEQIEACHKRDINVPIYITVQWDHFTAQKHPEWLVLDEKGNPFGNDIYDAGFYRYLCVNTPYRQFLKEQTTEVLENFDVDGIFFDIVQVVDCSCPYCRADMERKGLNPLNKEDRLAFAEEMIQEFDKEMTEFVHQYDPDIRVFYNSGHVGILHRDMKEAFTHYEVESLPSGGWGYMHFPIAVRYARKLGGDCLGMTGKFHTSWGDFHSFKNREALEYECYQMLSLNAKCSVGDQLEPHGQLSIDVYNLIGSVYKQVEAKEAWCENAEAVTDIAVITPEESLGHSRVRLTPAIIGVTRLLQEAGHQFDIIDTTMDLNDYRLIILPDRITLDKDMQKRLEDYIDNGGKIIATYESGLNREMNEFMLDTGVKLREKMTTDDWGKPVRGKDYDLHDFTEYILPEGEIGTGLANTEHAMYIKGMEIENLDADVLANVIKPYFYRSYKHFSSHRQAPSTGEIDYPAVVKKGNLIYFPHPVFIQYAKNAPRWYRRLVLNAVNILIKDQLIEHDGPSSLQVTINRQKEERRLVVHLLHYIPERRTEQIDIIDYIIPLYNLNLSIKEIEKIKEIKLVPKNQTVPFEIKDGRIKLTVDKVMGHQMLALEY